MLQGQNTRWTANRILALAFGIIFALLGIIGFFTKPENSTGVQAILGIFDSDPIHNIVYLITGLLGIAAALMVYARMYNRIFGIVYIVWGLLALIPALYFPAGTYGTDSGLFLSLTHMNAGDIILHIIAGIIAIIIGFFVTDANRLSNATRRAI